MRKIFQKQIAAALTAALIAGSCQFSALQVRAQDQDPGGIELCGDAGRQGQETDPVSSGDVSGAIGSVTSGNPPVTSGNPPVMLAAASDRVITNNLVGDFNCNFEGYSATDKMYWWNDGSYGKDGIDRVEYGEGEKPSDACGSSYIKVIASDSASRAVCQMSPGSLKEKITGESAYEYSYYVRLAEGSGTGSVAMSITDTENQAASVAPDAVDLELSDSYWTKVTGIFTIGGGASKIAFSGSEGLTYYLDNLEIGAVEVPAENALEAFNGNCEDVDEAGKPVFWSGDNVVRVAYGEGEAPSETCGAHYLSIPINEDGKSITRLRITTDEAAGEDPIVKGGIVYCFSYWAKLSRGTGAITFTIKDKSFGGSVAVEDKPAVVLNSSEWKRVTGTFQFNEDQYALNIACSGQVPWYLDNLEFNPTDIEPERGEIEKDIPNFKDAMTGKLSSFIGGAMTTSEMADPAVFDLAAKHFNAVTFGNEMKPDAILGYSGFTPVEETIDGIPTIVPKLDFSMADKMLNKLLVWNEAHPESPIKVKGHVLVWHAQTPEWFFREEYDEKAGLVDKETMDKRLKWFIKSVLEHYTGTDSKYKDMFYGWDVVNEAVSDGGIGYRTDSNWWRIYGSEEFIVNAFKYANQYAPASLELYYNDYNEFMSNKTQGILNLLKAVKAQEGAPGVGTRITAMGMQGHYATSGNPSISQFESSIRAYAEVVGAVNISELDLTATGAYDGTEATKDEEYKRLARRYKELFDCMIRLKEEGIRFTSVTFWGVVDKYSWLQSTSGGKKHCPMLFDDDYKAKPAFWILVDPDKVDPDIQSVSIVQDVDGKYTSGKTYNIERNHIKASFIPVWAAEGLKVKVSVADSTRDEQDSITVYVDPQNTGAEGAAVTKVTVKRSEGKETTDGYEAEAVIALDGAAPGMTIGFDVVVQDKDVKAAFNDYTLSQDSGSKFYARAACRPYMKITKGTVTVDGEEDDAWKNADTIPLTVYSGAKAQAGARLMWDEEYLYVFMQVKDSCLNKDSSQQHEQDSIEVFIDENNAKSSGYQEDDKQYRINYANEQSFNGTKCKAENINSSAKITEDGYIIEAALKWTDITPEEGLEIGLDLQVNDADDSAKRIGTVTWYDSTGNGWSSPEVFGTAMLAAQAQEQKIEVEGVEQFDSITVLPGTLFEQLALPEKATVNLSNHTSAEYGVVWEADNYNAEETGVYTLNGTLSLPDGISNSSGWKAVIKVSVQETYKEDLKALIQYAEGQKSDDDYSFVVPAVKKAFEKALEDAGLVAGNKKADAQTVLNAYKELLKMVHMLSYTGQSDNLKVLADAAEGLDPGLYTAESAGQLKAALEEARKVLENENALQEDIDAALAGLQKAMDGLVLRVDKDALKRKIEEAEAIDLDAYLASGKEEFTKALTDARAVYGKDDASAQEVRAAYAVLQNGIMGLREKPDKARLEELILSVQNIELVLYTDASAAVFQSALTEARYIFGNPEASKEEVAAAVVKLDNAAKQLEKKPDDGGQGSETPDGQDQGSQNQGNENQDDGGKDMGAGQDSQENAEQITSPKTGDMAMAGLAAAVMAAGVCICLLAWRRKRFEDET